MSSHQNSDHLLDLSSVFIESWEDLEGLPICWEGSPTDRLARIKESLRDRGIAHVVPPLRIDRLRSAEHSGYPLERTLLVLFNREKNCVIAELKEVSQLLDVRGIGIDQESALRDLERRFDLVVQTKVRIPPHARHDRDEHIRLIVNHLVNWEQFDRENPTPHLLWGRIASHGTSPRPKVFWLVGPDGLREQAHILPRRLISPYFLTLQNGDWFQAVVLEYPDRIEWVEPPAQSPDPTDPAVRKAAWDAIPRVVADKLDVWPLKKS
jgi:hypothetical protein